MQLVEKGSGKRPTAVQTNDSLDGGTCVVITCVDVVTVDVSDDETDVSIVEGSEVLLGVEVSSLLH